MTHKCEYCSNTVEPCSFAEWKRRNPGKEFNPETSSDRLLCSQGNIDKNHVCCTCDISTEHCELPVRIVCDAALCNLKYTVDWYKIKLGESQGDIAKLKALNNQFRIANIGSQAAKRLVEDGTLDISGIKLFVSKQKLTWEDIPIDTGYILMCLHEEFAKQWAGFLNEKAVKVQIKKELIQSTEAKLATANKIREGKLNADETTKKYTSRSNLNPFEKIVLHNMRTLKMAESDAVKFAQSMGATGEIRPETKFSEFK